MADNKPRKKKMGFGTDFISSLVADFAHSIACEIGGSIFDAFKNTKKEKPLEERVQPLPEDAQRKILDLVEKLKRFEAGLGDLTTDEKEKRMKEYRDLLLNQRSAEPHNEKPKTAGFIATLEQLEPAIQETFWRWVALLDDVRRAQFHTRKGELHSSVLRTFLKPYAMETGRAMTAEEAKSLHASIMASIPAPKIEPAKKKPLESFLKQAETIGGPADPGDSKPDDPDAERKARKRRARNKAARRMF